MHSRLRVILATALIAVFAFAAPGVALEKSASRITDLEHDTAWRGSSSCTIIYYNTCTGWIWSWSGWSPNDVFGVALETCCLPGNSSALQEAYIYFTVAAPPAGYGFTGSIDVQDANNTTLCPEGAVLATQPFLPATGFNTVIFTGGLSIPDASFAMSITAGATDGNTMAISTDHPAAGPTGPVACGTCYPTTRVNRSFYWGTTASPFCPGSALNDGICDAQFVWDVVTTCTTAVEQSSWGEIKALYR
jgi:hypothetical protein